MIRRVRIAAVLVAAGVAIAATPPVTAQGAAQGASEQKLARAKSISCAFSTMSRGDWKDGQAFAVLLPSTLTLGFDAIDTDEGTARAVGTFGPSDIVVRLSQGTLHLMQSFREGPLYTTTLFPRENPNGRLQAVHTRHEFTPVSLPGFTSRPEQYYGDCATQP
jgi:hypothetical protein